MSDIYLDESLRTVLPLVGDFDATVKSVNHRGYSDIAPENTLVAYRLSKYMGYKYVETDVCFTSDSVPVLSHDATIDRCSTGSGTISAMTYEDIRQYDFGSWKSDLYAGEKIPNFKEFIRLCKSLGLHPYIEIKSAETYSKVQLQSLVDVVKKYGMQGKVTWISFNMDYLNTIGSYDTTARIGLLHQPTADRVNALTSLRDKGCEVFFDSNYDGLTDAMVNMCIDANIPLEVWTVNDTDTLFGLNPYISGITTNSLNAGKELYISYLE